MTQTNFQLSATQNSTPQLRPNYIPSPPTRLFKVLSIIYMEIVITCRNYIIVLLAPLWIKLFTGLHTDLNKHIAGT